MINNIKNFLICAFVSALYVVSLYGRLELSQNKIFTSQIIEEIKETENKLEEIQSEVVIVDNESIVVKATEYKYLDIHNSNTASPKNSILSLDSIECSLAYEECVSAVFNRFISLNSYDIIFSNSFNLCIPMPLLL